MALPGAKKRPVERDLFIKVGGMPEVKDDARFATLRLRSQNRYILAEKVHGSRRISRSAATR
jgi:hypothetical protein